MSKNVQIFHFNLKDHQDKNLNIDEKLDAQELKRANRYLKEQDQRNYKLQRFLIKITLKKELGLDHIEFAVDPRGKPYIVNSNHHFNISHSKNYLVIGLNNSGPIGVDIEYLNPKRDILSLAEKLFTPAEKTYFLSLNKAEQIKHFYQIWTQKEAYLKYIGSGIDQSLTKINLLEISDLKIKTIFGQDYIYSWIIKS